MADVTISSLSPLTPSTGLVLPVSNGSTTGKVTLAEVCGVMTSTQIVNALGYTPYNGLTNPNGYINNSDNSVARGYGYVNGSGTTGQNVALRSYGIQSVIKTNSGRYTINTSYSIADASIAVSGDVGSNVNDYSIKIIGRSTNSINVVSTNGAGTYNNANWSFVIF